MSRTNIKLDDQLKEQSAILLQDLGVDLSIMIDFYLTEVVQEQDLPATLSVTQDDLTQALKEIDRRNNEEPIVSENKD